MSIYFLMIDWNPPYGSGNTKKKLHPFCKIFGLVDFSEQKENDYDDNLGKNQCSPLHCFGVNQIIVG